jgi:hypothetical protein
VVTEVGGDGSKSGLALVLLRLSLLLRAWLHLATLEALSEGAVADLGRRRLNVGGTRLQLLGLLCRLLNQLWKLRPGTDSDEKEHHLDAVLCSRQCSFHELIR